MKPLAAAVALATALTFIVCAQVADAPKPVRPASRVIGEITALDATSREISIRADSGGVYHLRVDAGTSYQRVPPEARDLKSATPIALSDLAVGDRVIARGQVSETDKSVAAVSVIVMTRADIAKKHERDREEWLRRSVIGTVVATDASSKTLSLRLRGRDGRTQVMNIDLSGNVRYRRYAPDSVKFSDAQPSGLAEIKAGDQLRALGEKDADGTRMKAEEVVSGSFRNIAAQIKQVNAAAGELVVTDLDTRKPLTIKVNSDSTLRKLPEQMAAFLAMRLQAQTSGGAAGAGSGGGAGGGPARMRPEGAPGPGQMPAGGAGPAGIPQGQRPGGFAGGPSGGPGGPGGGMFRGGGDISQMLERLPALALTDLKPGDALMVSSTTGADPLRVTAITLIAGVEPLLTAPRQANATLAGQWNFGDIGLPTQ